MAIERNHSLDLVKAFALLTIFINHIPGNMFESFTIKNFGFSDASEIFVLAFGMSMGLSYGPKFIEGNRFLCFLKLCRKAFIFYRTHILMSIFTIGIFCAGALLAQDPSLLKENNIYFFMDAPSKSFVGFLLLGYQIGYNNILSLYFILFFMTPLLLYGLHRNYCITLGLSFLVWLFSGIFEIAFPNYPMDGYWFFNPLSWQFLFCIGMLLVMHNQKTFSCWISLFSFCYLIFSYVLIHSSLWGKVTWFSLPPVLGGFDKTFLSVSRLLHILSLAYIVHYTGFLKFILRFPWKMPFLLLGKYSLPVFFTGTILAMIAQVLRKIFPYHFMFDLSLLLGGIFLQFFLAYSLEWLSKYKKNFKT